MVYRFKYDDDDDSLIHKQQLASSDKNASHTVTANELPVKDLNNMMWIMNGPQKEAKAKSTTTTTTGHPTPTGYHTPTESSSSGGYYTLTESSSSGGYLEMAKNVAVVGGAALAAGWGLYCLLSSTSSPALEKAEKMMKAPGKINEYIVRQPFEDNPRAYFAALRNSKR